MKKYPYRFFATFTLIFYFFSLSVVNSMEAPHVSSPAKLINSFEKGDLLYGLQQEARKPYIPHITKALKDHNALCTADRYNNQFVCMLVDNKETFEEDFQRFVMKDKELIEDYGVEYLNSLSSYVEKTISNIKVKKPDYFDKNRTEYQMFRRFCKEAIDYTISNGHKIHFLLDGLDVPSALNKTGKYAKSYTSSELRYIRDNWDRLNGHVTFYRSGLEVKVPWEE